MSRDQERNASLPITHDLTLTYALSFVIAILMAAASIAGLMYRSTYPSEELLRSFVPNDVVNALIIFLLLQPFLTTAPFVLADVVVIFIMGLICFVPFARFVRGAVSKRSSSSA